MVVNRSERVWRTSSQRPSTQSPIRAGATKSKVMLTVGRNLRRPTRKPPPMVPTRSATVIIMPPCRPPAGFAHVLVHAKAQHELIARALLAALEIEVADVAVEGGIGPVAIEIDAQVALGRIVVLHANSGF